MSVYFYNLSSFSDNLKNAKNTSGKFNLDEQLLSQDIFSDKLKNEDRVFISYTFRMIEKNDLFLESDSFETYEKFFINITLEDSIDYSVFFSSLKNHELFNLKKMYFQLLVLDKGKQLNKIIKKIIKEGKKFCNDEETTLEILNLEIPLNIRKKYFEYNQTSIKDSINKIKDTKLSKWIQREIIK